MDCVCNISCSILSLELFHHISFRLFPRNTAKADVTPISTNEQDFLGKSAFANGFWQILVVWVACRRLWRFCCWSSCRFGAFLGTLLTANILFNELCLRSRRAEQEAALKTDGRKLGRMGEQLVWPPGRHKNVEQWYWAGLGKIDAGTTTEAAATTTEAAATPTEAAATTTKAAATRMQMLMSQFQNTNANAHDSQLQRPNRITAQDQMQMFMPHSNQGNVNNYERFEHVSDPNHKHDCPQSMMQCRRNLEPSGESLVEKQVLDQCGSVAGKHVLDQCGSLVGKHVLDQCGSWVGKHVLEPRGSLVGKHVLDQCGSLVGKHVVVSQHVLVPCGSLVGKHVLDQCGSWVGKHVLEPRGSLVGKHVLDQCGSLVGKHVLDQCAAATTTKAAATTTAKAAATTTTKAAAATSTKAAAATTTKAAAATTKAAAATTKAAATTTKAAAATTKADGTKCGLGRNFEPEGILVWGRMCGPRSGHVFRLSCRHFADTSCSKNCTGSFLAFVFLAIRSLIIICVFRFGMLLTALKCTFTRSWVSLKYFTERLNRTHGMPDRASKRNNQLTASISGSTGCFPGVTMSGIDGLTDPSDVVDIFTAYGRLHTLHSTKNRTRQQHPLNV